ncbi:hypothetical protein Tco_0798465 [Tanacetum coccineum]
MAYPHVLSYYAYSFKGLYGRIHSIDFDHLGGHFKGNPFEFDELRSPDCNLFSDEEYSEEEEAKAMAETMEQYMSKTRTDYGSGVARPKIEETFLTQEVPFQLRELPMLKRPFKKWKEIKKVNKKVYAAQVGCEQCKGPYYTKDCPLKEEGKTLEEAYYTQFGRPFQASHIDESIPQKEKDPGSFTLHCFINNVCFDNALVDLGASVSVMPLLTYLNLGLGELAHTKLTVELADRTVKYPKGITENVLVKIGKFTFPVDFIILGMPKDFKMPLILGRPFLSTACAKIDVYKRKITLRVREEKIIFKSVKPASSFIKRVYILSLRERMELDLEARLMGETLMRNQGDDLMPTIEEGEVIEEFRTRDEDLDNGIDDYPSYCDYDKKIHIDFLENMDDYHDEGMGDVIFSEPFLREVGIKARRFDGMITIYNGDDEVTYQIGTLEAKNIDEYWWRIYKSRDLEVLES